MSWTGPRFWKSNRASRNRYYKQFGVTDQGIYELHNKRKYNYSYRNQMKTRMTEHKFVDTTLTDFVTAATGNVVNDGTLVDIDQGTGDSQRIGRKILVKSLFIQGHLYLPITSSGDEAGDRVRMIIFHDKQANKATATVTGILESAAISAFRNLDYTERFKVLKDKQWTIKSGSAISTGFSHAFINIKFAFPKLNIPILYDSTDGDVSHLISNNIGVMIISALGVCTVTYKARVRYVDA